MNTQPIRKRSFRISTLVLLMATLIGSCSKPESAEPNATLPARYELKDMRYYLDRGDRIDTTTRQLTGASLQNPSSIPSTQQFTEDLSELTKTSQFTLDAATQLPQELDLSKFEVRIPRERYSDGANSLVQSIDTYPLSSRQQQRPYAPHRGATSTITIPAKSKIDLIRRIDAYELSCSFECILENTTSGQRYALKGKWQGIFQYNNLDVTLKQSAL